MKIPPMCNPLLAPQQSSAQALQPDAAQRTPVALGEALAGFAARQAGYIASMDGEEPDF